MYALERFGCASVTERRRLAKTCRQPEKYILSFIDGLDASCLSMCYEVLPFLFDDKLGRRDSLVIVVFPLISLMVYQVQSLRHRSVNAAILSQSESKVDNELLAIDDGIHQSSLLYCAPEAIDTSY